MPKFLSFLFFFFFFIFFFLFSFFFFLFSFFFFSFFQKKEGKQKDFFFFDRFIFLKKEIWQEVLGQGIFAVDGEQWVEKRKVSSYLFNTGSLRSKMSEVFLKHSRAVADHLAALPSGQVIDLQDLFARYTFDSICTIAFGMEVNSLGGNARDVEFQVFFSFLILHFPPLPSPFLLFL